MTSVPLIRSVMTPFPHAIDIDAPLTEAQRMMARHRIRHVPVKDGDDLVGVITDREIKLALGPYFCGGDEQAGPQVRHACIFDVLAVEMTTPLRDVAGEMARRRIGSALVTKAGRLAGIFTVTDACRYLAELLGDHAPAGDDAA